MPELLYFEDLRLGDRWTSRPRRVNADDVHQFAALTWDFTPLHWDSTYAAETPFGRPIVHGMLGLSCAAGLSSECPMADTVALLGISDWRFLKPIYHGDEIRLITEVRELEDRGRRRGRVSWRQTLVNQDGQEVQQGTMETLVARRGARSPGIDRSQRAFFERAMVVVNSADTIVSVPPKKA